MSSGAELNILALPIAAVAVGALALTAGIVVVGGVALVGVGRLGVAAGSAVADRVRERARVCADDYVRFQQARDRLKAVAEAQQARGNEQQAAPIGETSALVYHEDLAIAQAIAERMAAQIQQQTCFAEQIYLIEQRARLQAAIEIHRDSLALEVCIQAQAALGRGTVAPVDEALDALRGALGRVHREEAAQLRARLRDQHAALSGTLALVNDSGISRELLDQQQELAMFFASNDLDAMRRRLRDGETLLDRVRRHVDQTQSEERATALASVWGKLQATASLISDLQSLEQAQFLTVDLALVERLQTVSAQFEALADELTLAPQTLHTRASLLEQTLDEVERSALDQLNKAYHARLVTEIETQLGAMQADGYIWERIDRTAQPDGTVVLKARQRVGVNERTLSLRIRPDGKVKYDTYGFADESCLDAVYSLFDRLLINGTQVRAEEPQIKPQVELALHVAEALKQLGYAEEHITVREGVQNLVVEASKGDGLAFQRRIVIDPQGKVRDEAQAGAPAVSLSKFIESVAPGRERTVEAAASKAVDERKVEQQAYARHRSQIRLKQG